MNKLFVYIMFVFTVIGMLYDWWRDDEHRTGLMLAAAEGHIPVMKILLDNHAAVNDGDKMKARLCLY